MDIPSDLKYATTHEWLKVEGDTGIIGITDFAQDQLGDIVYVELPDVGNSFSQGEEFGTIESAKAVGELKIPVDGKIIEINEELADSPEKVNEGPYTDGWMIKIKISNPDQINSLMDAETYAKHCEEEKNKK